MTADRLRLLTLDEAADLLRCSKATIRRRVAARKLPAVRDGRLVRIRLADLHAFLRAARRWK